MANSDPKNQTTQQNQQVKRPNETGSIHLQAHIKIHDPVTKKVYLEGRA
jgi:hypothetical protein